MDPDIRAWHSLDLLQLVEIERVRLERMDDFEPSSEQSGVDSKICADVNADSARLACQISVGRRLPFLRTELSQDKAAEEKGPVFLIEATSQVIHHQIRAAITARRTATAAIQKTNMSQTCSIVICPSE